MVELKDTQITLNNSRIALNTIFLYIRMLFSLGVGLFTSRIILYSLGVEDYGIYNLVGGFVSMFLVVRAGLVSSAQRFLSYELGQNNKYELKRTFSTIIIIYIVLALFILILAEFIGVWFLETKLSIPKERMGAAYWVFQLSLFALIVGLLSNPYNALIIAHERMKAFAYITIYEVLMKLLIAFAICYANVDKLILYAALMCLIQISVPLLYWMYCRKKFEETDIKWYIDWGKIKTIYGFAGYSMLGGFAYMGYTQGLNLLLGMFFTPIINAARGVAVQVQSLLLNFVTNVQTAIDPQIIKSYARGDTNYMNILISASSRYSFYVLFILSLPLMFEAEQILNLWLIEVPQNTSLFLRLIIITTMFDTITNPIERAVQATGFIRKYYLTTCSILLLIIPTSYIALNLGFPAYSVFVVHILIGFIVMNIRFLIAHKMKIISLNIFLKNTIVPILMVVAISVIFPSIVYYVMADGIIKLLVVCLICIISVLVAIFFLGIQYNERVFVVQKLGYIVGKARVNNIQM